MASKKLLEDNKIKPRTKIGLSLLLNLIEKCATSPSDVSGPGPASCLWGVARMCDVPD